MTTVHAYLGKLSANNLFIYIYIYIYIYIHYTYTIYIYLYILELNVCKFMYDT